MDSFSLFPTMHPKGMWMSSQASKWRVGNRQGELETSKEALGRGLGSGVYGV